MTEKKNENENEKKDRRRSVIIGASVTAVVLLLALGIAANASTFMNSFDPSSFLDGGVFGRSDLSQADDSTYMNDDVKSGDSADMPGEGRDKDEAPTPDNAESPESGQGAGVSAAQLSQDTNPNAGTVVSPIGNGDSTGNGSDGNTVPNGNGQTGGDSAGPVNPGGDDPVIPVNPGGDDPVNPGGGDSDPVNDDDQPPAVERPAAMGGVTLLQLNQSGSAVFSTKDGKDTIDPTQNLDGLTIVAVLYDSRTGTKWTRTLTYGNVDGYTYTIASSCFPLTSETKKITLVYYLYGNRYTVDVPCKVGDKLTLDADSSFFDHLNVNQDVSNEDLAKHLSVAISGSPVDVSLCKVTGFDTSQKKGTYTATVTYAGLTAKFKYTLNEVAVNFHTPATLVNCEERNWGHMYGWSPTDMKTRFNGTEMLSETLTSSTLDLSSYSQQLMGDLYWTEDCDGMLGQGTDPNFTATYAVAGTAGQLDDWFVGWATADPASSGGAVDNAWLQAHLLDSHLSAENLAGIAKEQGTGGSVDLYPVMRSDTTISADGHLVKYNEVSVNYAGFNDSLEYRAPAQMWAGFTADAVQGGVVDVPTGVTYVSLSPYMTEWMDGSAYESAKQLNLPLGLEKIDQTYPEYGWPYYSDKCGSYLSENVLPNVVGFSLASSAANHGTSEYGTCAFTIEREGGSVDAIDGLVSPDGELVALPSGGVGENDKLTMAEGAGVTVIDSVAISHMEAKSIEFASSVERINTDAFTSSQFDTVILNSAPTIMSGAFCGSSSGETYSNLEHGYTSLVLRSTKVPDFEYAGWDTFLNKGSDEWYWDDEALEWVHSESPSDDTFENLQKAGIHIYVPNQDTLVRCYSEWAETIDGAYATIDEEGNESPQSVTAFLLRIDASEDQSEIYTDENNVVYLRGDDGDTILYAPPTLSGYYMVPERVIAIAPSAFAECVELEGVIVNPRADGKLPALGEYAFGNPDETGYAAPPDTLKIYLSSELKGVSDWRKALESQYWHTSDQDKAENASVLVDMMLETGYESYSLNEGSLYALADGQSESGEDQLALLRANENSKGVFELADNTVKIGAFAFSGCEAITALANIDDVTEIGDAAFLDCRMLNVLALPASLEKLGDSVFLGCSGLEAIAFNSAPKIGESLFVQAGMPTVFMPSDTNAAEGDAASLNAALSSAGVQDIRECAYSDGSYSLMHDTMTSAGFTRYYRGLYTAGSEGKQVTFAASRLGDESMGDEVQSVNLDDEVTEIADGVFAEQPILMAVYGGDNLTKIGDGAFKDCPQLYEVSLGAFDSKVEWVGDDAFSGCANLNMFAVPRNADTCAGGTFHVGDRAFKDCAMLAVTGYASDFFTQAFVLPSGVNIEIGAEAFEGCASISKIPLPDGNVSIGERAFAGCTSITRIDIAGARNGSTLSIGEDAFCDSPLAFVNLAGSQVSVGSGALASAANMYALFVADGASVAEDAFPVGAVSSHVVGACPAHVNAGSTYDTAGADGIVSSVTREGAEPDTFVAIQYPSDGSGAAVITRAGDDIVEFIAYSLNEGSYVLGDGAFKDNTSLEKVSFGRQYGYYGGQVIGLGDEAFKGCTSLTNTGLGDDEYGNQSPVIEIGASCYEGCTGLAGTDTNAWTPLQTIGNAAFKDCTGIETVDIPMYTTSVGDEAFKGCVSLTQVNHWWASDAHYSDCTLGKSAFEGCSSLEVYGASAYLQNIASDCFKGCDKVTLEFVWTGDPGDASTFNLPTLGAHPFGTNADGTDLVPDANRIVITYENALGGAVDTNATDLAKLFTDENGWLSYAEAFTYVDADGNKTTNSKESEEGEDKEKDADAESEDGKDEDSADKEASANDPSTASSDDDANGAGGVSAEGTGVSASDGDASIPGADDSVPAAPAEGDASATEGTEAKGDAAEVATTA